MRTLASSPLSAEGRSLRRRARVYRPRGCEALEQRVMLDGRGFADAIVVGRTLSSWTVPGVQNNRLQVEYSVYNQQSRPLSGVLLLTTLADGVAFVNATIAPNREGQSLAWSLGTLAPYGRARVSVTVELNPVETQQIDTGSAAFASLDAYAVSDTAPSAALRNQEVDPALLAATVDANSLDPFVQEQAARLDYDADRIFAFLRDEVGFESYVGSSRGARGTLWSRAGNALDEASLGVALFRASGIPARYAQGTLSDPLARQLILSMFPEQFQVLGMTTVPGDPLGDPAHDPLLLAEARSHYWVQFDSGGGFLDIDTAFKGSQIGQTFTARTGTFVEVDDALRHKTTISVHAETFSPLSAVFGVGNGLSTRTVMERTFNDVELVGRPITVGHFVTDVFQGALIVGARTSTFTPYMIITGDSFDQSDDEVEFGESYQQVLTNLPFFSQALTGAFIDIELVRPGGQAENLRSWIFDLIGIAGRTLGTSGVTFDSEGPPPITPYDLTTINVLPGRSDLTWLARMLAGIQALEAEGAARPLDPFITVGDRTGIDPFQIAQLVASNRLRIAHMLNMSDLVIADLARQLRLAAYYDSPRVTIAKTDQRFLDGDEMALAQAIDLRYNTMRVLVGPGQSSLALPLFEMFRGMLDTTFETMVVAPRQSTDGTTLTVLSTITLFERAQSENVPLIVLQPGEFLKLDALEITDAAKALISQALGRNMLVIVPARSIVIDGEPRSGWFEIDAATGRSIGVLDDGGHQAITERLAGFWFGFQTAFITPILITLVSEGLSKFFGTPAVGWGFNTYFGALEFILQAVAPGAGFAPGVFSFAFLGFALGLFAGLLVGTFINQQLHEHGIDPPTPPIYFDPRIATVAPQSATSAESERPANRSAGNVQGTASARNTSVRGEVTASWTTSTAGFEALALDAAVASVTDASGAPVGAGTVSLAAQAPTSLSVAGSTFSVQVGGQGSMSFYGPARASLGAAGEWRSYTASLSGAMAISLTTPNLVLNGLPLPAGTYTITTNSAALSGRGATSSPAFAGSATILASSAVVEVGAGTGALNVGGQAADLAGGMTFTGYTGRVVVSGQAGEQDVATLNGSAERVIQLAAAPSDATTNHSSEVVIQPTVSTSLAGTYTIAARAPDGWRVTIDETGTVRVRPAPGLQAGTHHIFLSARSHADEGLVASTVVPITIEATQPGITFRVDPDELYTVSFEGAQIRSAFRAVIHNAGPASDRFDLAFSGVPAGFHIVASRAQVTIPAGETAVIGVYLMPDEGEPVPAVGTLVAFNVSATSTSDAGISETAGVNFVVPEIHAVSVELEPDAVSTLPGLPATTRLTLRAFGNVPSTVTLVLDASEGLTATGLTNVVLAPGEVSQQTITLTPGVGVALNSTLMAGITATYGPGDIPWTQELRVPVRVVVPGADSLLRASDAARSLGNPALAARLDDLSIALTNLVQSPTDPVAKSQALASLDSIITLLSQDSVLATFLPAVQAGRAELLAANDAASVEAAVVNLGAALDDFGAGVVNLTKFKVDVTISNNSQVSLPNVPTVFNFVVHNTGSEAATYNLSVVGLPGSVQHAFSQDSVTLAPQEFASLSLTLTDTATDQLLPYGFTIFAAVAGAAPVIRGSASGSLSVRGEFVSVVSVTARPPFGDPGTQVDVTARLLNAVNRQQDAHVFYSVRDATDAVVFTSTPVAVQMNLIASLVDVDLGALDTTGFAEGNYSIEVTVLDNQGQAISGASGHASLLIGSPVTASQRVEDSLLLPGTSTVTNTITIASADALVGPLALLGLAPAAGADHAARFGDVLYAPRGNAGIAVYDIGGGNMNNPQLVRTIPRSSFKVTVHNDIMVSMVVTGANASTSRIDIFSLADPSDPLLLGSTGNFPYGAVASMIVTDTHVFVTIVNLIFFTGSNTIIDQNGGVLAFNISDRTNPFLDGDAIALRGTPAGRDGIDDGVLFNENGTSNDGIKVTFGIDQSGGNQMTWDIHRISPAIAYVTGSSATGNNPNGVGLIRVIDISDPRNMRLLHDLAIPGTAHAFGMAVDGDRAFFTASSGPLANSTPGHPFTGQIVIGVLDVSTPGAPRLLGMRTLADVSGGGLTFTTAVGGGQYVFGSGGTTGNAPRLYLVDANNPQNMVFTSIATPALVGNPVYAGDGLVLAPDKSNVGIYRIQAAPGIPATLQVQVPNHSGVSLVPGSFNFEPTQIIPGGGFDTLVFTFGLTAGEPARSIAWQSAVSNLQPGEARDVTLGATIDFTVQGADGRVALPNMRVAAAQILGMTPASQTVRPGETAEFTVHLNNPTNTSRAFTLSVGGIPAHWAAIAPSVNVPAHSTVDVPLLITSDLYAPLADHGFTVTAGGGFAGAVAGTVRLLGDPVIPDPQPQARGVVLAATPQVVSVGQGGLARFTLRVTNTGSATETFHVNLGALPSGVTANFGGVDVVVPPGASQFRDIPVVLSVSAGAGVGAFPITFTASSLDSAAQASTEATLAVSSLGVALALTPGSNVPGGVYSLLVTNLGTQSDTFDLALGGPAALVATLGQSRVTLAPGASTQVPITTSAVNFALPGLLELTGIASSTTDQNVRAAASAGIAVAESKSMTASANPELINLEFVPGSANFQILVHNTGNVFDIYRATILSVSSGATAGFIDFNGNPAQSISGFTLLALSTGALALNVALDGPGNEAVVQVQVQSETDPTITSTVSVRLTYAAAPIPTSVSVNAIPAIPTVGQSVVLTAIIIPLQSGGTLTGFVTFAIDGVVLTTVPVRLVGNDYQASISVDFLTAGQHLISAEYGGDGNYSGGGAALPLTVHGTASAPPRVLQVRRFGFHARPTTLVVTFDRALDPATAADPSNYVLRAPGGRIIRILSAQYDAANLAVILRPAARLPLNRTFRLTVFGNGVHALRGLEGARLDGDNDGAAGGNHVARINRASLVLSVPLEQFAADSLTARALARSIVPGGPMQARRAARPRIVAPAR